jgi:hypothetical protein
MPKLMLAKLRKISYYLLSSWSALMRDIVQDRYGNTIYLTDERWEHIIERHPELDGHRAEILRTVRLGRRRRDPFYPDTFYYTKKFRQLKGWLREIEAVVVFHWQGDKPNNFVLTAYPA